MVTEHLVLSMDAGMKSIRGIGFLCAVICTCVLSPSLAARAAGDAVQATHGQTATSSNRDVRLSKVQVNAQKQIFHDLQLIKVALKRPESWNPKLANVMICRLTNQIGSHAVQVLSCGTNAALEKRTEVTELAYTIACTGVCGIGKLANVYNEMVSTRTFSIKSVPVNGPGLRSLLDKIPMPASTSTTPLPRHLPETTRVNSLYDLPADAH